MRNEATVAENEVHEVVKNIGIPPCPVVLTKLVRAIRDDDPDFQKISILIGGDVGLAAAMLKTVNSPFYGLRTKVSSVSKALALLGLRNVERLVMGLLLRESFSGAASKTMEDFWESSSRIALITAWLAPKVKNINHDDAYTFSLFRDCGTAALIAAFKQYRPAAYGEETDDTELYVMETDMMESEKQQFGTDHATLGHRMATSWLLPDNLCDAVLYHHEHERLVKDELDISETSVGLIVLALASECIYTMQTVGKKCQGWDTAGNFVLEKLGLTASELDALVEEADRVLAIE